ncbi:hypothetical protein LSH36_156g05069 [Paralvinella palmiformis]|uniref:Uncharacterized protein n=1 Tax=Paralvinella palmiformis TaxID=53620 RepID=A0AAD9JTW3_9ANNE|nr:hypothetical protein LSH36_156g05069 [Paralvinella palmiformis]
MDIENKEISSGDSTDVTVSPAIKSRQSLSPRKRAFREVNEDTSNLEQSEDVATKRSRVQKTEREYPEPYTAHVAWKLETGRDGGALLVDDKQIIIGTNDGKVIFCDLDGHVTKQLPLTRPVGALMYHEGRLYAWCHAKKGYEKWKGALIDLSFDSPMVLFDVEEFGDHCIHADMVDGCLAIVDNNGNVGLFGCDGAALWKKEHLKLGDGGFLLADESGIYVAHKKVVRCYNLGDGDIKWEYICPGGRQANISKGYQSGDYIYIEGCGKVLQLNKQDGELQKEFVPYRHQAAGVCTGSGIVVTGNNPTVIFDEVTGKELYRMFISARLDRGITWMSPTRQLFLFWDQLYCIDMTEEGLHQAAEGKYSRTFTHKVPDSTTDIQPAKIGTLTDTKTFGGVIVTCSEVGESRDEQIKVTVSSDGYDADWPVLLPRDVREPGKQFVVDKVMDFTIAKYRPDVKNTDGEDDVTNTLTNQESDAEEAAPTN